MTVVEIGRAAPTPFDFEATDWDEGLCHIVDEDDRRYCSGEVDSGPTCAWVAGDPCPTCAARTCPACHLIAERRGEL